MKLYAAILTGYNSRPDRSLKIVFSTSEATPEDAAFCQSMLNLHVCLAIKEKPFESPDLELLDKVSMDYTDTSKSPSKRLKGALYRNWEINSEGYSDFTDYYIHKMNTLTNHFISKLP